MWVPLCVVSVMISHAHPSPPGRSDVFRPGNIEHNTSAFSLLETYLICGRMIGGSTTVSLSSGIEISMIVLGRCMLGFPPAACYRLDTSKRVPVSLQRRSRG